MTIKHIFHNIFTSGFKGKIDSLQKRDRLSRLVFLNFLLIFSVITLLLILFKPGIHHNILNKVVIISEIFILSMLFILNRIHITQEVTSSAALFFILLATSIGVINGGLNRDVLFFVFPLPMIILYLKGSNRGIVWLSFFTVLAFIYIVLLQTGRFTSKIQTHILLIAFSGFFVMVFLSFIYQKSIEVRDKFIIRQLYYDALTGLPNRNMLLKDLDELKTPVLFLINVDSFSEINDGFGPRVGDSVLKELSILLKETVNEYPHKLFRLSGDEFALVFPNENNFVNWELQIEIAHTLSKNVSEKRFQGEVNGLEFDLRLRVSIGIADSRTVGIEHLLTAADMALRSAKKNFKPVVFFKDAGITRKNYEENMFWLKKLAEAIEENRIVAYYQPIFDNKTGKISKYESLVRLVNEDGQVFTPYYFLDIAKKSRLYPKITQIMFSNAISIIYKYQTDMTVNLSVSDILDPFTHMFIYTSLANQPRLSGHLIFELLESEEIEKYGEVTQFIKDMKEKGCRFAIDDFGSGYSNFEYVLNLNIDFIKIAGELIRDIHQLAESRILVENIAVFARKLGIQTVAEFVHNQEVFDIVKEIGIDYSQGFHLGKPEPNIILTDK